MTPRSDYYTPTYKSFTKPFLILIHSQQIQNMLTCKHMLSTSAQTNTHYKCNRFPGCFDLSIAVMSLVIKLLFPFNIVYRHRHLLQWVVFPLLRCTVLPVDTISTPLTRGINIIHICKDLMPESIKISVYGQNRSWIIHALHVGWKNCQEKLLSSTFPLSILIRAFIYLIL